MNTQTPETCNICRGSGIEVRIDGVNPNEEYTCLWCKGTGKNPAPKTDVN
jgi:DnaJ-class molecular chaperone